MEFQMQWITVYLPQILDRKIPMATGWVMLAIIVRYKLIPGSFVNEQGNLVTSWIDKNGLTHNDGQPDFDLDVSRFCDPDGDGDGYLSIYYGGCDCDDLNPNVYPGNGCPEVCGSAAPKNNTTTTVMEMEYQIIARIVAPIFITRSSHPNLVQGF